MTPAVLALLRAVGALRQIERIEDPREQQQIAREALNILGPPAAISFLTTGDE